MAHLRVRDANMSEQLIIHVYRDVMSFSFKTTRNLMRAKIPFVAVGIVDGLSTVGNSVSGAV